MLDNPDIKAILCARGGYGSVHIVDQLDFSPLLKYPKWVIGFSDITVLLCHIHANLHIASIHSKMCNSFPDDWTKAEPVQVASILSLRQALSGNEKMQYSTPPHPQNRPGTAEGQLVGGNLKTIETLAGTRSDIDTAGKILLSKTPANIFTASTGCSGICNGPANWTGLAVLSSAGSRSNPTTRARNSAAPSMISSLNGSDPYGYPVCFDFPVGHQKENYAFKYGVPHTLVVGGDLVSLTETPIAS